MEICNVGIRGEWWNVSLEYTLMIILFLDSWCSERFIRTSVEAGDSDWEFVIFSRVDIFETHDTQHLRSMAKLCKLNRTIYDLWLETMEILNGSQSHWSKAEASMSIGGKVRNKIRFLQMSLMGYASATIVCWSLSLIINRSLGHQQESSQEPAFEVYLLVGHNIILKIAKSLQCLCSFLLAKVPGYKNNNLYCVNLQFDNLLLLLSFYEYEYNNNLYIYSGTTSTRAVLV